MAVAAFGRNTLPSQKSLGVSPQKDDEHNAHSAENCPYCGESGYTLSFEDRPSGAVMSGACEQCGVRVERFLPGWRSPGRGSVTPR
jgi:hypothetical protein